MPSPWRRVVHWRERRAAHQSAYSSNRGRSSPAHAQEALESTNIRASGGVACRRATPQGGRSRDRSACDEATASRSANKRSWRSSAQWADRSERSTLRQTPTKNELGWRLRHSGSPVDHETVPIVHVALGGAKNAPRQARSRFKWRWIVPRNPRSICLRQ